MNLSKRNVRLRPLDASANAPNPARNPTSTHWLKRWIWRPRLQQKFHLLLAISIVYITLTQLYLPAKFGFSSRNASRNDLWLITVAKVDITPTERIWQGGFISRNRTVDSTQPLDASAPLYARAICIRSDDVQRAPLLLMTLDVIGIDRALSDRIYAAAYKEHGLTAAQLRLVVTHTHSGPVVCSNLFPIVSVDDVEMGKIHRYCQQLFVNVLKCIEQVFSEKSPVPAHARFAETSAALAVNRRQIEEASFDGKNRGTVDDRVPVLWFQDMHGVLVAGLYGYAAHATVLTSTYQYSPDYPGMTTSILEDFFTDSFWMFVSGCGGDINIYPRGTPSLLINHATTLRNRVIEAITKADSQAQQDNKLVMNNFSAVHSTLHLPFNKRLGKTELRQMRRSTVSMERATSRFLLHQLGNDEHTAASYEFPISVWRLGDLTIAFLGGEPTVGYALRLKRELNVSWVVGYSDDVMGYVGTADVLREGKREGSDRAAWYYGLPSTWHTDAEDIIVEGIRKIL